MMLTETVNMAHLGARAFEEIGGEVVQTTAFVRCASHVEGYKGTYCRLIDPPSQQGKEDMFLSGENHYMVEQQQFARIPGESVAYWLSSAFMKLFEGTKVSDLGETREGLSPADNDRFLRLWPEVESEKWNKKWFPYTKGRKLQKMVWKQ